MKIGMLGLTVLFLLVGAQLDTAAAGKKSDHCGACTARWSWLQCQS